jgi:hypothetical protein
MHVIVMLLLEVVMVIGQGMMRMSHQQITCDALLLLMLLKLRTFGHQHRSGECDSNRRKHSPARQTPSNQTGRYRSQREL